MSEMDVGETVTGRRAVLAVGASLATTLAGCSGRSNTTTTTGTRSPSTVGGASPKSSDASGRLGEQFAAVRSTTTQYADVRAARADGYAVLGPSMAGMGWHLLDQQGVERATKGRLSRTDPPLLTYLRTDDGLTLGAVEYAAPVEATPDPPNLFADGDASATETWSIHHAATHAFATPSHERRDPRTLDAGTVLTDDYWAEFRPPDFDLKPGDRVSLDWGSTTGKSGDRTERVVDGVITHPDLRTLHVWLHEHNPAGVFAHDNPRFGDGSGHHHDGGRHHTGGHGGREYSGTHHGRHGHRGGHGPHDTNYR